MGNKTLFLVKEVRAVRRFPAFLAIVFVCGQLVFWSAFSQAQVRFASGFRFNPHYVLPVTAALEKGLWENQGVKVKWLPFRSTTTMNRAVAAGEIDMGSVGLNSLIKAVSAGIAQVAVADPAISTDFYFWVRSDARIKTPKDLKGAKLGVTRFGSESHAYAVAVLRALGVEKDVKVLSMGGGRVQIAALKTGGIDISNLSFFTMAAVKARGEVRSVLRANDYLPKDYQHLHLIYSLRDFLKNNPARARKIIKGFLQGAEFVMKNRSWTIDQLKAGYRYPQAAAELAYPLLQYDVKGKLNKSRARSAIKFLVENNLLARDKAPPLAKLFAEGYTP